MLQTLECEFKALGTEIFIQVVLDGETDRTKVQSDINETKKIFLEKQKILNRFDANSKLSFLNKNLNQFNSASEDIINLANKSLHYYALTNGLFDPRILDNLEKVGYKKDFKKIRFENLSVPSKLEKQEKNLSLDLKVENNKVFFAKRMDFNGIAKGYITDIASNFLKGSGWKNYLVDSGGDMRFSGFNSKGDKWKIALEDSPEKNMMISITDGGIATSGIIRKNWKLGDKKIHHLVNPRKPEFFSFRLKSVTMIAENTEEADVWAKILFLMGLKEGKKYSQINKLASIFLDSKNNLWISPEAHNYIDATKDEKNN